MHAARKWPSSHLVSEVALRDINSSVSWFFDQRNVLTVFFSLSQVYTLTRHAGQSKTETSSLWGQTQLQLITGNQGCLNLIKFSIRKISLGWKISPTWINCLSKVLQCMQYQCLSVEGVVGRAEYLPFWTVHDVHVLFYMIPQMKEAITCIGRVNH